MFSGFVAVVFNTGWIVKLGSVRFIALLSVITSTILATDNLICGLKERQPLEFEPTTFRVEVRKFLDRAKEFGRTLDKDNISYTFLGKYTEDRWESNEMHVISEWKHS